MKKDDFTYFLIFTNLYIFLNLGLTSSTFHLLVVSISINLILACKIKLKHYLFVIFLYIFYSCTPSCLYFWIKHAGCTSLHFQIKSSFETRHESLVSQYESLVLQEGGNFIFSSAVYNWLEKLQTNFNK